MWAIRRPPPTQQPPSLARSARPGQHTTTSAQERGRNGARTEPGRPDSREEHPNTRRRPAIAAIHRQPKQPDAGPSGTTPAHPTTAQPSWPRPTKAPPGPLTEHQTIDQSAAEGGALQTTPTHQSGRAGSDPAKLNKTGADTTRPNQAGPNTNPARSRASPGGHPTKEQTIYHKRRLRRRHSRPAPTPIQPGHHQSHQTKRKKVSPTPTQATSPPRTMIHHQAPWSAPSAGRPHQADADRNTTTATQRTMDWMIYLRRPQGGVMGMAHPANQAGRPGQPRIHQAEPPQTRPDHPPARPSETPPGRTTPHAGHRSVDNACDGWRR
jgi:hypothetical protein